MWLFVSWLLSEIFNTVYFQLFGDRHPDPAEMKPVGTVSKLCIYPLKSGRRLESPALFCEPMGPRLDATLDRALMVTDEEGGFLTARRYPEMVRIVAEPTQGGMRLSAPGAGTISISFSDVSALNWRREVRVWEDRLPALDCGDEAAAWISAAIPSRSDGARLCWFPDSQTARRPNVPPFPVRAVDGSAFADLTGYMLMNEASVAELGARVDRPVSVDAFRGNIVVSGSTPFAEDRWRYLAIGDALFENVKPCTRCLFTTIDPETGVRDALGEPLKTLRQYRLNDDPALRSVLGNSPLFGINLGLRRPGEIKVGDTVYAAS
ncbi:mitochondrial amidoxime-reducing component 1-like [Amphibalanus amphitrite]|uniref:mitochondrial amidoxime-reducing component 1-like n=1 Tax=Amphibalanus amphitrite TaxID=1232801 RepID=UPI001C911480|nr:mitochondrial amidoxime-reducing component 1-like [Amphibalanus amphitrite]